MTTIEKKSLGVGKFVDTNHVDTLIRTYKQERWQHNSERIGKNDSMSAWFSIEELETFIEKVREKGGNGVRLYFGAYTEDYNEVPGYAGRQTVVMVGSKAKETPTGGIKTKDIYVNTANGTTILAYGEPAVCPPWYCPVSDNDADSWGGIGTTLIDRGDKGMIVV